jgi:hypothetical protein
MEKKDFKSASKIEIKNIDSQISIKEKIYTICFTFVLAIIYEGFFTGKQWGVSVPVFYILFMGFFFWSVRGKVRFKKTTGFFMIIPTLLVTFNYSIHSNSVLSFFNGIMIVLLTCVITVLIRYENIKWDSTNLINMVFKRSIKSIPQNIDKPFIFIKSSIASRNKKEMSSTKKSIIRGLVISIPLLIVVLILLTSADMVFNHYISNLLSGFQFISIGKLMNQLLVILIVFIIIFSYIWSFKYSYDESGNRFKNKTWDAVTVVTIIFMINIVYLLFSIVQFSYLYGGVNNALPSGFTYSEYARKGFFELVAVTIINFTILLSSMNFIKNGSKTINIICNMFLTTLVVFTLNMLFSAHFKMSLYEQTYGFTYLRIFVHLFMIMLFMLLIVLLIGIWNRRIPLNKVLAVIILSMYILLNYINVDKIIAQKNIEIYYKTQKIDVQYLRKLSYDAIPEIIKLKDDSNIMVAMRVDNYLEDLKKELAKEQSWYEFNYSKYKARKVIEEN